MLGVAYKRDIDDMRESPAMDIMGLLLARGAKVSYADPFVPEVHAREWSGGYDLKAVDDASAARSRKYDCVVIVTDHKAFDYESIARRGGPRSSTRATPSRSRVRRCSSSEPRAPRKAKKSPWPDRSLFCRT